MKKTFIVLSLSIAIGFGSACKPKGECVDTLQQTYPNVKALVAHYKKYVKSVSAESVKGKLSEYLLIDVRMEKEWKKGYIKGAVHIPRGVLAFNIAKLEKNKNTKILVYCKKGGRGALAAYELQKLGYNNVYNLKGGWLAAKNILPTEKPKK